VPPSAWAGKDVAVMAAASAGTVRIVVDSKARMMRARHALRAAGGRPALLLVVILMIASVPAKTAAHLSASACTGLAHRGAGRAELSLLSRANLLRWRPRRSFAWADPDNCRWSHLGSGDKAVRINRHNAPTSWQALAVQGPQGALAGLGFSLCRCQIAGGDEHSVVSAQNAESPTSSDCGKLGTAITRPRHCVAFTQGRCDRWA
jgi:hypothetical protein